MATHLFSFCPLVVKTGQIRLMMKNSDSPPSLLTRAGPTPSFGLLCSVCKIKKSTFLRVTFDAPALRFNSFQRQRSPLALKNTSDPRKQQLHETGNAEWKRGSIAKTPPPPPAAVLAAVARQIAACGSGRVPAHADLPEICHNYAPSAVSSGVAMETPATATTAGGLA